MVQYKHFSEVYDQFSTDYRWCTDFIEKSIRKHAGDVHTMLEIACGTGNVLQQFADKYEIAGLDISPFQLKEAREKMPGVQLYEMDMTDFTLGRIFDVVLCMYDSINHLLGYENWVKTFRCVRKHLTSGGIFIFDMNTLERLERFTQLPPGVQIEGDTYLISDITKTTKGIFNWNMKVFQKVQDNMYRLSEDNITETAFPPEQVKADLERIYKEVYLCIPESELRILQGGIFFVCKA